MRADDPIAAASGVRRFEEWMRELERLLSSKRWKSRFSRRSTWRGQKSDFAVALAAAGRFLVKVVNEALEVALCVCQFGTRAGASPSDSCAPNEPAR